MSLQQLKESRTRFDEVVVNQRRLEALDDLIDPEFVDHVQIPGMPSGIEGVKMRHKLLLDAFPDLKIHIEDMVAEGDRVASRLTISGTHQGPLFGMPATGRRASIEAMDIIRFRDGRMIEHWGVLDMMGLMQQLGAASSA